MRQRWLSKRAVLFHLALLIWFPGCLVAAWWQVESALAGNGLSYLYSVEWPAFAIGGVYAWWLLVHIDGSTPGRTPAQQLQAARRARADAAAARRKTASTSARRDTAVGDMLVAYRQAAASTSVAVAVAGAGAGAGAGGAPPLAPATVRPETLARSTRPPSTRPPSARLSGRAAARAARRERGVDEKLAAYNARLARLAAGTSQTWRS